MTKRKRCIKKGCRKIRAEGSEFCTKCTEDNDPVEASVKVTELEALKFGKIDAEMRNLLQGIRLVSYEAKELEQNYQGQKSALNTKKITLEQRLNAMKPAYEKLVGELSKKYSIESKNMAIDPDTRVIRDVTEG